MLYEKSRELFQQSFEHWVNDEVFSLGWFLSLIVLIIAYAIWIKLLDKKRAVELLLIGSLEAVAKTLNSMFLGNILGLVDYSTRLIPVYSNIFLTSMTISPIIVMLSEQYSSSWGGYILRSAIGFAILCFGIFTLYDIVGIIEFHNWNVFYHFLVLLSISLLVRVAFLWIVGIQKRAREVHEKKV